MIEIDVNFSDECSFYAFLTPLICLDHIPFGLLLFGPARYKFTVKIGAVACSVYCNTSLVVRVGWNVSTERQETHTW